jgi:type II secretory pathway pseudopilin PulG
MKLAQATQSRERGFAMAGLLVGIALLSLGLSIAMPTWRTLVQREKEEELIWRGQQYDRAIQLYRKKNAAPGAPSVDRLVEGRFLRKKFKDPITGGDFELVGVSQAGNAPGVQQPQRGYGQLIGGVRSKSKAKSFRVLNGRSTYADWQFTYVPWKPGGQPTVPGQSPTGAPNPGQSPSRGAGGGPFRPGGRVGGGVGGNPTQPPR